MQFNSQQTAATEQRRQSSNKKTSSARPRGGRGQILRQRTGGRTKEARGERRGGCARCAPMGGLLFMSARLSSICIMCTLPHGLARFGESGVEAVSTSTNLWTGVSSNFGLHLASIVGWSKANSPSFLVPSLVVSPTSKQPTPAMTNVGAPFDRISSATREGTTSFCPLSLSCLGSVLRLPTVYLP